MRGCFEASGLLPACAGIDPSAASRPGRRSTSPRVSGDRPTDFGQEYARFISPRVRGDRPEEFLRCNLNWNFSRVRGNGLSASTSASSVSAFSPRARGWPSCRGNEEHMLALLPVGAGMALDRCAVLRPLLVCAGLCSLRWCGDRAWVGSGLANRAPDSPWTRGSSVSPAAHPRADAHVPRGRGDPPFAAARLGKGIYETPRTRGRPGSTRSAARRGTASRAMR